MRSASSSLASVASEKVRERPMLDQPKVKADQEIELSHAGTRLPIHGKLG
jgi:hypothetical protein